MSALEAALDALKLLEAPNYAATVRKFKVNRETQRRRHKGLQLERQ